MANANDVIRAIEAAFGDTVLPPAVELMNEHCEECVETSLCFADAQGRFLPWRQVVQRTGKHVEPALLTVQAWRYYLPALMLWCVRDTSHVDVLLGNLVNELTPPVDSDRSWFAPRTSGFAAQQRRAVLAFLRWYEQREQVEWEGIGAEPPGDAANAIQYWAQAG